MRKKTPTVEWTLVESDADWERLSAPPLPEKTPPAGNHLKPHAWSVAALLLLLMSAGGIVWRTGWATAPRPTPEVTILGQEEPGESAPGRTSLVASITDHLTPTGSKRQVAPADSVPYAASKDAPAHRQTRFYRRTITGWAAAAPDTALWGPERRLETPYFSYHFRQNDALAVVAVAPQVDALYATMRRNFGLPIALIAEKLVIDVRVTQPPGQALSWFGAPDRLIVPSPALYLAPVELTDAELLAQSLVFPLLAHLLAQTSERYQIDPTWQPLMSGLQLWQVWDMDQPLSVWREEVVKWLYFNLPASPSGGPVVMPERYNELCAAHKLWISSPLLLNIPLLCAEGKWEDWYWAPWRSNGLPARLDQLLMPSDYTWAMLSTHASHPGQTVVAATLIEYAVITYGRERLPALVAGLGKHQSWQTLLPAVFGVSAAEFEAGWHTHLAAHYGVSPETHQP